MNGLSLQGTAGAVGGKVMHGWSLQGIEVAGLGFQSMVDDSLSDAGAVNRILQGENFLVRAPGGKFYVDPDGWYPLEPWIRVFGKVSMTAGPGMFYEVGLKLAQALVFPDNVRDALGALQAMNTAYLMNHRRNGQLLVDPLTGKPHGNPLEGIGYYACEKGAGPKEVIMRTENPYPCDLDRGLVTGVAKRFAQHAFVLHDDNMSCRKRGQQACSYVVRWM